ncbi:MAG: D-alanine--D-alanine ligase [Rhodothermaceae bacterium]|nr:D-alanine--D-alanine ligase [Rhodothermaceae bacterium]
MSQPAVIIAFGGVSPEHEVSVITAMQAAAALKEKPYRLVPLYITKQGFWFTGPRLLELETYKDLKSLESEAHSCHFAIDEHGKTVLLSGKSGLFSKPETIAIKAVIVAFHGSEGENGSFQGLCEQYNLPYTGCGVTASALGMDKRLAKRICKSEGIPVVDDVWVTETDWSAGPDSIIADIEKLGYPVFVKPVHLGSSIGVMKARTREDLQEAIETAFRYDSHLIVEKAVSPLIEINCSVLGSGADAEASVCEQPLSRDELLSFEDKYLGDAGKGMASATRHIPAPVSDELTLVIRETSLRLFRLLDCSGLVRLDFLVEKESGTFYFNEINTIPGSFSFYLWDKSGSTFPGILDKMIQIAEMRHREKNGRVRSYETNLLSTKAVRGLKGLKGKG